tara:strand:+ start:21 stop:461 length:441 start_codon:yes stop_codon:yes gene_type:complete
MNKQYLTWADIDMCMEYLYPLCDELDITHVIGINRGGLIPAVILSHMLGKPHIPITITLRHGWPIIDVSDKAKDILNDERNTIAVVDDINDSGATFDNLYNKINIDAKLYDVVLFDRASSQWDVHLSAKTIHNDDWIVFPWEDRNE